MALQKSWIRQEPASFTADGGSDGLVTVGNVFYFKVKQKVVISSSAEPDLVVEVKKVLSLTTLLVGPLNNQRGGNRGLLPKSDISAYLVADSATIKAEEQSRPPITNTDITRAVFEEEPTLALRSSLVDRIGNGHDENNPLPISPHINQEEKIKQDLLNASDLVQVFTFTKINGQDVITQIVSTSANVDAFYGSTITLTKVLVYIAGPLLSTITDTLTIV